jgi:NaMN:DMB phosphoribosyltransferase
VLLALGYDAARRVSGSVPGNAHALKLHIVDQALRRAGIQPGAGRCDPLGAVAEVGDPMQPLAAGIARGATRAGCEVLLAGGSQMLAVAALIGALAGQSALDKVAIGTTRWIVDDPAADVPGLACEISPELAVLAANLDFSASRHAGLRAYEQFRVKEGVGAGGACLAALLGTGMSVEDLQYAIDATYDGVLSRLPTDFEP